MKPLVTVIDYGSGNLFSVARAFEHCGADVTFASDAAKIDAATHLVLPGVGAFAYGMTGLRERALVEPIRGYAARGRPLLGICLGMQMLASASEEFGENEGLNLVPGRVVPVPTADAQGRRQKVPYIGWSALARAPGVQWSASPLADTAEGASVYLVHSYHLVPDDPTHRLAECVYGGQRIAVGVRVGNVVGFQFHPEKSGPVGLGILDRFLRGPSSANARELPGR
jgi:glutamine amidotransferase